MCFAKQKEKDSKIFCYPFIVSKKSLMATAKKGCFLLLILCVFTRFRWALLLVYGILCLQSRKEKTYEKEPTRQHQCNHPKGVGKQRKSTLRKIRRIQIPHGSQRTRRSGTHRLPYLSRHSKRKQSCASENQRVGSIRGNGK